MWSLVQYGAGRTVTFVSTLVLARLLAPEHFGLVALAMVAINAFDRVKDLGVAPALVQHPQSWPRIARTGLVLTTAGAAVVAAVCALTAPALARLLATGAEAEALEALLRALSAALFLTGLGLFADAALARALHFKERVLPELVATAARAVVSIGLAVAGYGAWSLIWGQLVGAGVLSAGYWWAYRRMDRVPHDPFDRQIAAGMVRFGLALSAVALLSLVLDNLDYFVIGRRLGAEQLGYYTIAFRVPEMIVLGTCVAVGKVLYSAFSRMQHDRAAMRRHYLVASREVSLLTVPMGLGIAAAATVLVPVLFGERYAPSIPLVMVLGVYSAVTSITFHSGEVYKALGLSDVLIKLALTQVAVFAPVLWAAAGHSVLAVALTFLAGHVLYMGIRMALITRVLAIPARQQLAAIAPAVAAGSVMAAVVATVAVVLDGRLAPGAQLPMLMVIGAGSYLAAVRLIAPAAYHAHPVFRALVRRGR